MGRKERYVISTGILLVVFFLTIGFSAFQNSLLIDQTEVTVRLREEIRVTGIQVDTSTEGVVSSYEDYNIHNIQVGIYLPSPDSSITYKVEVTNFGNQEMGIFDITDLPTNLTYELDDYQLKEKVCDDENKCALGAKKEFFITIRYKEGSYNSSKLNYSLNLNVDFRRFYTITYVDIDTTNKNYPTEVIAGDNFQTTFLTDIPSMVKLIGSEEYSYEKDTLSVLNVNEDIIINRMYKFYEKILSDNRDSSLALGCPETIGGSYKKVSSIETSAKFCSAQDDYGTSHYFRGGVTNNYVYYAGYYWRIIRINGNNTVRMIYAGSTALANGTNDSANKSTAISSTAQKYNNNRLDNAYVGYMYGTTGATNYADTHKNINSSVAKTTIDNWFQTSNLSKSENRKYLADSIFCSDRSLYSEKMRELGIRPTEENGNAVYKDTFLGYAANKTYYESYYRLIIPVDKFYSASVSPDALYSSYPTLICKNKEDRYTVNDTVGNTSLTNPIGLITADEVVLAGGMNKDKEYYYIDGKNPNNKSYYLYTGYNYWTMTGGAYTSYANLFAVIADGWMSGASLADSATRYYRPVINIREDTFIRSGNGTISDPYRFE